jgi:hypothetical protein
MSRTTRYSRGTQLDAASRRPSSVTKVPPEIMREVFKLVVLSSEEARSHGVKALCLVGRYWNNVANATPDLWTKVTLTYPLHADQLSAAQKWLKASEPRVIDVEVVLYNPDLLGLRRGGWIPSADSLQSVVTVLRGSEHRWRSISVKSDTGSPIQELLRACVTPGFPALESISFERLREYRAPADQRLIKWPALFGGDGTLMPKLREMTLCAIPVDWTLATATPFQNLRKLVVRHHPEGDPGPTWEQFSEALDACRRLETLDVGANYNAPGSNSPVQVPNRLVRLPALKHLIFGWSRVDRARDFLTTLQIPETLETLCLFQAERTSRYRGRRTFMRLYGNSTPVFEVFFAFTIRDSRLWKPSISMLRLKSLSVTRTHCDRSAMISFLRNAPMIEEICLTNVTPDVVVVVEAVAETLPLKRLDIR